MLVLVGGTRACPNLRLDSLSPWLLSFVANDKPSPFIKRRNLLLQLRNKRFRAILSSLRSCVKRQILFSQPTWQLREFLSKALLLPCASGPGIWQGIHREPSPCIPGIVSVIRWEEPGSAERKGLPCAPDNAVINSCDSTKAACHGEKAG